MKLDHHSPSASRHVAKRTMRPGRAYVICSPKNNFCEVRLESWLEQSVAHALELDPRVTSYRAQPFTFNLTTRERLIQKPKRKPKGAVYYTPDFVAMVGGIEMVIEVKHQARVNKNEPLFTRVTSVAASHGMRFLVVTEESLWGHFRRNTQILNQYAAQARTALPKWSEELRQHGQERLSGPAVQVLKNFCHANHYLAAGVLSGQIYVDLCQYALDDLHLVIQPAWGSLSALEVLSYA
jgi:hypothetical protein